MNAKNNSQLNTSTSHVHNSKQYLLGTEIKTRKMSKIPAHDLPYNLRKQSTVNRKMTLSRKMTMRRGTMSQHMRESKFDPENHQSGGSRPTTLLEPIIQESDHSLTSREGGFQEKEEHKVAPVGTNFVKTIKTRSNVAKAIKRFTRNSNFGKRSSKKAGTETVCVKFKLNETGEALQSFAVSKTGVAGGGHTARGSKVSILQHDDKTERLRSKMSLINSSQSRASGLTRTTSVMHRASREVTLPSQVNMLGAISKTKMMLSRARSRIDAREKDENKKSSIEEVHVEDSEINLNRRMSRKSISNLKSRTSIKSNASNDSDPKTPDISVRQRRRIAVENNVPDDNETENINNFSQRRQRRQSVAPIQSIGIYSTTNNSNQRSAKCTKTNEKLMKL